MLSETFTARQQIRNVYGFPEKLDIDRYTLPDPVTGEEKTRDYVVAVRELNSEGLSENQDTWINRHTVYTHGNGFVAAPANEVVAGQEGGEPNFTTRDLPTVGNIEVDQPRIYYGELIQQGGQDVYSVVGAPEGADAARVRPARGRLGRGADQQHLRRRRRGVDRQLLPPADLRHLLPGAQLPALQRGQRRVEGALRPRPAATAWRRPRRSWRSTATRTPRSSTAG